MCSRHKRRLGKKPLADCTTCWLDYFHDCPDAPITASDLHRFFFLAFHANIVKFKADMLWRAADDGMFRDALEKSKLERR